MAKTANDQHVLDKFCALKASIRSCAAEEIAASKGAFFMSNRAHAHTEFVKCCGWNSRRRHRDALKISAIKGTWQIFTFAKAHARFAKFWGWN